MAPGRCPLKKLICAVTVLVVSTAQAGPSPTGIKSCARSTPGWIAEWLPDDDTRLGYPSS